MSNHNVARSIGYQADDFLIPDLYELDNDTIASFSRLTITRASPTNISYGIVFKAYTNGEIGYINIGE